MIAAVRAYSAAYLRGETKTARLMLTDRGRAGMSYAEFRAGVLMGQDTYSDAEMTSIKVVKHDGKRALVTYRYDISDIDQVRQHWRLAAGKWMCKDK